MKDIKKISLENCETPELAEMFIKQYSLEKEKMLADGELPPEEINKSAITFASEYIGAYKAAIESGHSEIWALTFAEHYYPDNEFAAMDKAYKRVREEYHCSYFDKEGNKVYDEAYIECKSNGKDPVYCKIYAERIMKGDSSEFALKWTEKYVRAYSEIKQKNKSDIFASRYAENMADGYSGFYALNYALCFESLLAKNKTNEYARIFSEIFAEKTANDGNEKQKELNYLYAKLYAEAYFFALQNGKNDIKKLARNFADFDAGKLYVRKEVSDDDIKELLIELYENRG